jgi:hypothetical protein
MALGCLMITVPFYKGVHKFDAEAEVKVYDKVIAYLEESNLDQNFIIYPNAYLTFKMDIDPFNENRSKEWVYDRNEPSKRFESGSVFLWDSHLGPNEGGVSEEELDADKRLRLITTFYPDEPLYVLGGRRFEVRVYEIL